MAAPARTTYEVKVSNELHNQHIYVSLQSELNYAREVNESAFDRVSDHSYHQNAIANSGHRADYQSHDNSSSNAGHSKSQHSSSTSSTNNSSTNTGGSASHRGSKSSTSNSASSSLNESSYSNQQRTSGVKASADSHSDAKLNIDSKALDTEKSAALSARLEITKINPGFVRIAPSQSLYIPVIVETESQIVYISVFTHSGVCIANRLQINNEHIQIKRDKFNLIIIEPAEQNGGFRDLLISWHLPLSLCDAMKKCGWHDPKLWHEITEVDLDKMGFKKGHIQTFNYQYAKWKNMADWFDDKLTFKALFERWQLPNYLYDNMKLNGWDDVRFWNQISDQDFEHMGFKHGHIVKFKHFIKDNAHVQDFESMQEEFQRNSIKHTDRVTVRKSDENADELDAIPSKPKFEVRRVDGDAVEIEVFSMKQNEFYTVEIHNDDRKDNEEWDRVLTIKKGRVHQINKLQINATYSIRMQAHNLFNKASAYTASKQFKTMRKIEYKKWNLVKSSKPDCVYGDRDEWIDRAEIGCSQKHAMSAMTMVKHIQSTLEKSRRAFAVYCPLCNERLQWKQCVQIAGLSEREEAKWTEIIKQRREGQYQMCDKCGAKCKRGTSMDTLMKMKCNTCRHVWCWECGLPWKGNGKMKCGNADCTFVDEANRMLRECPSITLGYCGGNATPQLRACPQCTQVQRASICSVQTESYTLQNIQTQIIETDGTSKHTRCSNCTVWFCYRCLKVKDPNAEWQCGNYKTACPPAARQEFV